MSRIAKSVIHAIHLSRVRHDVKSEIEGSSPDEFHFRILQLWVHLYHSPPQDFCASTDRICCFGKKGRTSTKQHAPIRREPVVVQVILGVVDHAIPWTQLLC